MNYRTKIFSGLTYLIPIFFLLYFIAKVNGYFDYSSENNIMRLRANKEQWNTQLMLDHEKRTYWGYEGGPGQGVDNIIVDFVKLQKIVRINMDCTDKPKDFEVYLYDDGIKDYKEVLYTADGIGLILKDTWQTRSIKIVASGNKETKIKWGIKELSFEVAK